MRRNARASWRRLVDDLISNQERSRNKGLWRLSTWSKRVAGKSHIDTRIPALRRNETDVATDNDTRRIELLAERFFPQASHETHIESASYEQAPTPIQIDYAVSQDEVLVVLRALPSGKTLELDRIPNEVLKALATEIAKGIA